MANNLDSLISKSRSKEIPFSTEFSETNEVLEQHYDEKKWLWDYDFDWEFIKKLTPEMIKNLLNLIKKIDSENSNILSEEIKFETEQVNMIFKAIAPELVKELIHNEKYKDNEKFITWMETGLTFDWLKDMDSDTTNEMIDKTINLFKEKILKEKIQALQKGIEETNPKKNWKEERNGIKYDRESNKVISRWKETEVENLDIYNDKIILKWLNLWWRELTLYEWLWLANLKNWIEYKYWNNKEVIYGAGTSYIQNKTLEIDGTMLIRRENLEKHVPLIKYGNNIKDLIKRLNEWRKNQII